MNQMPEKLLKLMHEKISIFNVDSATGEMRGMLYAEGFDSCYQHLAPLIQTMREALESIERKQKELGFNAYNATKFDFIDKLMQSGMIARQALEKVKETLG